MADEVNTSSDQTAATKLDLEKLRIDAQLRVVQMRYDLLKVICGTMIVGLAAAVFPFAQEIAKSEYAQRIEDIKTHGEFARLREQNRLAETLAEAEQKRTDIQARRTYLEALAKEARSDRIETQIIAAEFFSFLGEPDLKPHWESFRQYLVEKQEKLSKEKGILLARNSGGPSSAADAERLRQIERIQNPRVLQGTFTIRDIPAGKVGEMEAVWKATGATKIEKIDQGNGTFTLVITQ